MQTKACIPIVVSRDYGYGVMGFPTFTFETDDDQFYYSLLRMLMNGLEELDVMRYLIENVWYWRASPLSNFP